MLHLRRDRQDRDRTVYDRTYELTAGKTLADVDLERGDALPDVSGSEIVSSGFVEEKATVMDPMTSKPKMQLVPSRLVRAVAEEIAAWAD
jgi:hypothetical protein